MSDDAEKSEITVREYKIYPLTEAIIIAVTMFAAILSTTYFIYHHAISAQKGEIREGLVRTAAVLTAFIDGDMHKTFTTRSQEKSDAYKSALLPFEKTLAADPSIRFVYTAVLIDGKVHFILDPTPEGDGDGDGVDDKAHIMDEYPEASSEIIEALKGRKIVTSSEPYKDRWGSFVSGYVPIHDSKGNFVGVLGIDIDSTNYFERLAPIKRATIRAMVTGFFIAFLVGAIVWFTRNFSLVITSNRKHLFNEYMQLKRLPK
ncbi:Conserved hypothetical protein [gamma proteobacterium HdN1]|nr:Conserved hypothetical protein [gamma proteobacterium HdN1]